MDELEISILNAITSHKRLALDFSTSADESIFSSSEARIIGKIFLDYIKIYKNQPNRRVLLDKHSENKDICKCINEFYDNIDDKVYNDSDYAYDIGKLRQRYSERRLSKIQDGLNKGNLSDVTSTVRSIERDIGAIKAINGQRAYDRKPIANYADTFKANYIEKVQNPELGKGILTGYSFFDYIKNGLRPADLIILAGETGGGKSMFLNNMAIQIYMQNNRVDMNPSEYTKGYNVTYFSLEMPYDDCFRRTLARMADVQEYGIRDARLGKAEAKGVAQTLKFIKKYPHTFEIVDVPRGFSTDQLEIMFEEIKADYIPDVVFIDYMGLMEDADTDSDDWLKLGKLAGKIHEFARAHSIPVITAVQLNRLDPSQKKSETKSIGLHRIGRSSLIAHHATVIIQIETRPDEETHDDFVYHIIKNRHGQSNKSHSVWKNFNKCSIIDRPYDIECANSWQPGHDISIDISEIIGEMSS